MKNIAFTLSALGTFALSSAFAHEMDIPPIKEKKIHHHFSPLAFYKKHKEGGYNYSFEGVGIKYDFKKDRGLNFGINISSNLETETTYIESESYFGIRFETDYLFITPKFINKAISHQIEKNFDNRTLISKGTSYIGIALQPNYEHPVQVALEGYLFRDLYNHLITEEGGKFHGLKFQNPFGFRINLNLGFCHLDPFYAELNGNFSRAFQGEYWEAGCQLCLSWKY